MPAEPLTDEQVEELRRAVEEYEAARVKYESDRNEQSLTIGYWLAGKVFMAHRHAILATADRLATQRRRMRKGGG